jgi:hypothetical protein
MKNGGRSWRVVTASFLVLLGFGVTGCGEDEEVESACCELMLQCSECGCGDAAWNIGASGDGKACRAYLDMNTVCTSSDTFTSDQARTACSDE